MVAVQRLRAEVEAWERAAVGAFGEGTTPANLLEGGQGMEQALHDSETALASERESRLRAERERDEARADVAAAEGRERQIDRLEAALMDAIAHIRGEYLYDKQYLTTPQQANLDRWNAALSSPAVTAEGKKLGEEGGEA